MDETAVIIKHLSDGDVKFVVIGGVAVTLYGVPRATFDLDILLPPDKRVIEKALQLLKKMGFKELHDIEKAEKDKPSFISEIGDISVGTILKLKSVKIKNKIDVDISLAPSVEFFNFIFSYRVEVLVEGIKISVPTLIDLIRLKELSGRPRDIEDAQALRLILSKK